MGDFKKNNTTMQKAAEERESRNQPHNTIIKSLASSSKIKSKVISAKVYPETWAMFTAINRAQGMSNNSALNMLISDYIRDKKEILNDI